MPYVIIRYGPYLAYGIIRHRIHKINGLFAHLDSLGYELEVIEINEYNRLTIEMYDREVFRCDIRHLSFNMLYEDDIVCQRAVKAVEEAKNRMYNVRSITNQDIYKKDSTLLNVLFSPTNEISRGSCDVARWSLSRSKTDNKKEGKVSKVKIVESKSENFNVTN